MVGSSSDLPSKLSAYEKNKTNTIGNYFFTLLFSPIATRTPLFLLSPARIIKTKISIIHPRYISQS